MKSADRDAGYRLGIEAAADRSRIEREIAKYRSFGDVVIYSGKYVANIIESVLLTAQMPSTPDDGKAEAVAIKALEWRAVSKPNSHCCYDHTTATSSIGTYQIEWKSWKDYPSYCVMLDQDFISSDATNLEEAKYSAQQDYEQRICSALTHPFPASDGSIREALEKIVDHYQNPNASWTHKADVMACIAENALFNYATSTNRR